MQRFVGRRQESRAHQEPHRTAAETRLTWLSSQVERLLVPRATPMDEDRPDDYRRVVLFVAAIALGFFVPSLAIAGVPTRLWLPFIAASAIAGVAIASGFLIAGRGSPMGMPLAFANAIIAAALGWFLHDYYHELALLYAVLAAAHASLHGLRAALVTVAMGAIAIPLVVSPTPNFNWTDPVYASIYLLGLALLPWVAGRLARRRAQALRVQLRATVATEQEAVMILARAAEAKDEITGDHVGRVGDLSATLAERAGLSSAEVDDIRFAAMLHDVGKLHVPDRILMKPGRLTAEEFAIVREHCIWGERILGSSTGFQLARRICRSHHENWDGSGYPDGLMWDGIPLVARVVHIADVFDALGNARPYKSAWPLERCLDEIERQAGRMFDPELVALFLPLVDTSTHVRHPKADDGSPPVRAIA
jgi:hypothetical protein